jgi:superfamily I DNA/RNA helicase
VDKHDDAYRWEDRSRDMQRQIGRATPYKLGSRRSEAINLPRLDRDDLVPLASSKALAGMLQRGMSHYLTYLDEFQRAYVNFDFRDRSGLTFIRGGAGTGKTAIAIHRALYLAQQAEMGRNGVQYLCYNRVLAEAVKQTIAALSGRALPRDLNVATFHEWCGDYLQKRGISVAVSEDQNRLAREVRRAKAQLSLDEVLQGLEVSQVASEILALKRLGFQGIKNYLNFERAGMGFRLSQPQREAVWNIFETVRFESSGVAQYEDLPAIALDELRKDNEFPGHRAVVVDEAQDCSPVMARLVREMVRGDDRRVMVLADQAQGIYPSGFFWALREFAPKGLQSVRLRKPYRSTRQIHSLASSLYGKMPAISGEIAELNQPDRDGPRPRIEVYASYSEVEAALSIAIGAELADNVTARKPQEIAVLVSRNVTRTRVIQLLKGAAVPVSTIDRSSVRVSEPTVKVVTVPSAKGLDFPSVYVYCFESYSTDPSDEDRAKLYVALTRSSFRLNVLCTRETISPLLHDLDPDTYELAGTAMGLLAR